MNTVSHNSECRYANPMVRSYVAELLLCDVKRTFLATLEPSCAGLKKVIRARSKDIAAHIDAADTVINHR